jgi:hypothetical protein
MIEARQLTFGVEIETVAPDHLVRQEGGLRLRIGLRHRGIQVPYLPPPLELVFQILTHRAWQHHHQVLVAFAALDDESARVKARCP